MRNKLDEIINKWDKSEPLVDYLLRCGVTVPPEKPKNNFERIKAMTIGGLARLIKLANDGDLIVDICDSKYCEECIDTAVTCSGNCEKAIIKYLESEVDAG